MGKGDRKTRRGKIRLSTFGKLRRPKKARRRAKELAKQEKK